MIQQVFVIKDVRTNSYNNPTYSPLLKLDFAESIKRGVMTGAIKPEASKYAELYYLGTYEDTTAHFELGKPELLARLGDYVEEPIKPAVQDA